MMTEVNKMPPSDTGNTLAYPIPGIKIDSDRLQADFQRVQRDLWKRQNRNKNSGWKGIALYSKSGNSDDLGWTNQLPVKKTSEGEQCAYICNELIPQFGAAWVRVAFYKLEAGTRIGEHRDLVQSSASLSIVRIHIPVITNEKVVMYLDRKPYHFPVGTAWYFDPTARHKVENNSDQDRIHLMVDFQLCESLKKLLRPVTTKDRFRFLYVSILFKINRARHFLRNLR